MTRISSSVAMTAVVGVLLVCGVIWAASGPQQPRVNPDAKVLLDFKQRIDQYLELHKRLEKQGPPLKGKAEAVDIKVHQDALAKAIRAERKNAKQGDIFTPEIATLLRRLMYPELKGPDGADTKAAIKDDAPAAMALKVNALYPDTAPLPTVPPNLLASVPQLPKELEYRILGKHLILRDVHANLIVDVLPNAIR
jgi:hypothetical protein